jgi:hypothetical protein
MTHTASVALFVLADAVAAVFTGVTVLAGRLKCVWTSAWSTSKLELESLLIVIETWCRPNVRLLD